MKSLQNLLDESSALHSHLCPRQVLGVRMGMLAGKIINLDLPQTNKRLLVFIETDGCFADGVSVATGATIGHRTLRVEDYGKIAGVFVDTQTGSAFRVAPLPNIRDHAYRYTPQEKRHYFAQLYAYQIMPDEELFSILPVLLRVPIQDVLSRAGVRVNCHACGEEIINEREVTRVGLPLCRACAGEAYYRPLASENLPISISSALAEIQFQ